MTQFSLITLVKNRAQQLINLLESAEASDVRPTEVLVVCMDGIEPELPRTYMMPIRFCLLNDEGLPLAKARNLGAGQATTKNLVFLDVDCICSPTLFTTLLRSLEDDVLVSASARYLTFLPAHGCYNSLEKEAMAHPKRTALDVYKPVSWKHFWSLVFAIRKESFFAISGFDTQFTGYGAEDTDFAYRLHSVRECTFVFCEDEVLHQYHTKYTPPVNYMDDIIRNAQYFHSKHGFFPMFSWLKQFEAMKLLSIDESHNTITKLKSPTAADLNRCFSRLPY